MKDVSCARKMKSWIVEGFVAIFMQPFVHVGCLLRLACSSLVLCRPKTVSRSTLLKCLTYAFSPSTSHGGLVLKRLPYQPYLVEMDASHRV